MAKPTVKQLLKEIKTLEKENLLLKIEVEDLRDKLNWEYEYQTRIDL